MRKLISILASVGLIASAGISVVSCGKKDEQPTPSKPNEPTPPNNDNRRDLDKVITNPNLGTILHKTKDLIVEAVENKNNIKLNKKEIEVDQIENNSAIIKACNNSQIYKGNVNVKFSLENSLEKITEDKFVSVLDTYSESRDSMKERMVRYFVYANWPIADFKFNKKIQEEIINKFTADYSHDDNKLLYKVKIEPKQGVTKYSGSVEVVFHNSISFGHRYEGWRSNLGYIFDCPLPANDNFPWCSKAFKIGEYLKNKVIDEKTILSVIDRLETNDYSICEGKPIDTTKLNVKIAKNKLSALIEPKQGVTEYNGSVRFWFCDWFWNCEGYWHPML